MTIHLPIPLSMHQFMLFFDTVRMKKKLRTSEHFTPTPYYSMHNHNNKNHIFWFFYFYRKNLHTMKCKNLKYTI